MRFSKAKRLCKDEEILIIEKGGKNPIYRLERIVEITIEDKNAFIRCTDGKLYHHTAIYKTVKQNQEVSVV